MSKASVQHSGFITAIENRAVKVSLTVHSSCSACHAKAVCGVSETENKIVEVSGVWENYSIGEKVNVILDQNQGFKAMFLGYVVPFFLVLTVLLITLGITSNELTAGIASLAILIPYYAGLYFYKDKIKEKFTFRIKRIE